MDPLDEQRLLQRCADKDRRAQNEAYEYYLPFLVSIAVIYLHDKQLVMSCVAETIEKLFQELEKKVVIYRPKGWLNKRATWICLDYLKKESHRMNKRALFGEDQRVGQGEWQSDDSDEWYEKYDRIFWQEIPNFAQSDQFIILAKYYHHRSYADIAKITGKDVAFLRNRADFVKKKIRKKYKR